MSRISRVVVVVAAVIVVNGLSACTPLGRATPTPVTSSPPGVSAHDLPTLLTWIRNPKSNIVTAALVAGELGVNDAGCITVGGALLMAPPESSVLVDGSTIVIAGHGEHRLGQMVQDLPGGYFDITGTGGDPAGIADCRSHAKPESEYAVVWEQ